MKIPLWAEYLATNKDGKVWAFEKTPEPADHYWMPQNRSRCTFLYIALPPKDWAKTLKKVSEK